VCVRDKNKLYETEEWDDSEWVTSDNFTPYLRHDHLSLNFKDLNTDRMNVGKILYTTEGLS
jgi:hypothetical protein